MPIIEPPADPQHLLQGDVLEGVRLYATQRTWENGGGQSAKAPHKLCLVLSRPCVIAHKSNVVVSGIEKYPDRVPKDVDSFAKVVDFLTALRDGSRSPDLFYLGQLPGKEGRFCARLDALYTVEIPSAVGDLSTFLNTQRIGSLNNEFVRDLHVRTFTAFANLGFNDQQWLSDDDLNWLVTMGQQELTAANLELQKAHTEKASRDAEGKQYKQDKIGLLQGKVTSLEELIEPYMDEQRRRSRAAGEPDH